MKRNFINSSNIIKLYRILLSLLFICLLASCSNDESSYFPLSKGYKWHYDVALITRDGLSNQKYILNNLGKGELEGKPVYLRRSLDGTILYYTVNDEGIVYLGNVNDWELEQAFHADEQVVMHYPVSLDSEWEQITYTRLLKKTGPPQKTEFRINAKVPLEVKVESLSEEVRVPAGQFKGCLKITMTGSTMKDAGNYVGLTLVNVKQTNWYAPGVGLIKMERIETTKSDALDKGSLLVELTEFETS